MAQKTIIFDFDGTLADTFYIAVGVFRKLARTWHITSDAEVERLRGMPARDALRSLGVRWWHMPFIAYHGRKAIHEQRDQVQAFTGMKEVVAELHKRGYRLFIVSSNSVKNIEHFLQNNKLGEYFESYHGGIGAFDKAKALTSFVRHYNLDIKNCYYVGDEVRDIDAARKAGMQCVSVSWGYNNLSALRRAKARVLVEKPKGLLKIFDQKGSS
jgi:phosphoglycolate phosphatase